MGKRREQVTTGLGRIAGAAGSVFGSMVGDLARVTTALGAIDFAGSANKYRAYTKTSRAWAPSPRKSVDELKKKYEDLAKVTGISDEKLAQTRNRTASGDLFERSAVDDEGNSRRVAGDGQVG